MELRVGQSTTALPLTELHSATPQQTWNPPPPLSPSNLPNEQAPPPYTPDPSINLYQEPSTLRRANTRILRRPGAFILTFLLWGVLIIIIVAVPTSWFGLCVVPPNPLPYNNGPCVGIQAGLGAVIGVLYLCLLINSLCVAGTIRYLFNMIASESAFALVEQLRLTNPTIIMVIECYHYETRTTYDSQGRAQSSQVRVNTHREREYFVYDYCTDVSGTIKGLENFKIAKIHFFKTYGFSDQYTSDLFHAQFKNLCDRNRDRDAHMDSYIHINIDGYKPYVMALLDLSQKPWYIQKWIYIVSALLGLSFFYRWVIDRVSERTEYTLVKQLTKLPASPTNSYPMGQSSPYVSVAENAEEKSSIQLLNNKYFYGTFNSSFSLQNKQLEPII